ncbi:MAG: ATP/cobalamin adenosyltransferase [Acidobacteriaceae bacterium]|nr:ATP/cobalamin adenosyltransferase [Acidobacteriaceae bacterium]
MSIATKHGDGGQTGLVGGVRVSKADLRVETYGSVDELNSVLGFARSICQNPELRARTEEIQKALFRVGGALATPSSKKKGASPVTTEDVDQLTDLVHNSKPPKASSPTGLCQAQIPKQPLLILRAPCAAALSATLSG